MTITIMNASGTHIVPVRKTRAEIEAMEEEAQSDLVWAAADAAGLRGDGASVVFGGITLYKAPSEGLVWEGYARGVDAELVLDVIEFALEPKN